MAASRATVLHVAETEPESAFGRALASVIDLMSDGGAQKALDELIQSRDAFRRWTVDAGDLETALAELADLLETDRPFGWRISMSSFGPHAHLI